MPVPDIGPAADADNERHDDGQTVALDIGIALSATPMIFPRPPKHRCTQIVTDQFTSTFSLCEAMAPFARLAGGIEQPEIPECRTMILQQPTLRTDRPSIAPRLKSTASRLMGEIRLRTASRVGQFRGNGGTAKAPWRHKSPATRFRRRAPEEAKESPQLLP
jgi:hypothetical protein